MQVSPSRTIKIGEKPYILDGGFDTLRAIQEEFNRDILHILYTVTDFRFDEVAKIIAIATSTDQKAVGEHILESIGVLSNDYAVLKTELFAWLNVICAPPVNREKKSNEMDDLVQRQKALKLSPGAITNDSPSASSDGNPANSGEAMSGN